MGDDNEAADGGEKNEDAQLQDRDVADEKIDDQQEGDTKDGEVDVDDRALLNTGTEPEARE